MHRSGVTLPARGIGCVVRWARRLRPSPKGVWRRLLPPPKVPLAWRIRPPSKTWFIGTPQQHTANGMLIGSWFWQDLGCGLDQHAYVTRRPGHTHVYAVHAMRVKGIAICKLQQYCSPVCNVLTTATGRRKQKLKRRNDESFVFWDIGYV